jgi:cytochrome c-type biogenesis protein CcmH/NrfG
MNAFVVGCVVFATGCFAALGLRLVGSVRRDGLLAVLLPLLVAALASASYAWYATPSAPGDAGQGNVAAGGETSELQAMANQIRGKLGGEAPGAPAGAPSGVTEPAPRAAGDLNDLARKLAVKLERDPGNGQGWALLARSYANLGQFSDAVKAFEKAAKLLPGDKQLQSEWADAKAMAAGGKAVAPDQQGAASAGSVRSK